MKLAFWTLLLLLVFMLVGFALSNLHAVVAEIRFGEAMRFENAPVMVVVTLAMLVGVIFTGVWALVEGASIRLDNRRLRRELQRLETENNFLRTQRGSAQRSEPDAPPTDAALADDPRGPRGEPERRAVEELLPQAPAYGVGEEPSDD
jgi:hypothetical protein